MLPAGQSQLPTEHHMICSDIRSGRDSPSASPFHACGLHHSAPWLAWKQVIQSQAVVFFFTKYFLVLWFLVLLTEGEKQPKLHLDLFTACTQQKHGSIWRPTPGLGEGEPGRMPRLWERPHLQNPLPLPKSPSNRSSPAQKFMPQDLEWGRVLF